MDTGRGLLRQKGLDYDITNNRELGLWKQQQEFKSRLGVLIGHLLKWQYQPNQRSKSWNIRFKNNDYKYWGNQSRTLASNPIKEEAISKSLSATCKLLVRLDSKSQDTS
jgi:hypothetical protein